MELRTRLSIGRSCNPSDENQSVLKKQTPIVRSRIRVSLPAWGTQPSAQLSFQRRFACTLCRDSCRRTFLSRPPQLNQCEDCLRACSSTRRFAAPSNDHPSPPAAQGSGASDQVEQALGDSHKPVGTSQASLRWRIKLRSNQDWSSSHSSFLEGTSACRFRFGSLSPRREHARCPNAQACCSPWRAIGLDSSACEKTPRHPNGSLNGYVRPDHQSKPSLPGSS